MRLEWLQRSSGRSSQQRFWDQERRCTLLAVIVILTFLLSNFPVITNNIAELVRSSKQRRATFVERLGFLAGNFLVNLNSASNFLIYCAIGHRFRSMFSVLFCPCLAAQSDSRRPSSRIQFAHPRNGVSALTHTVTVPQAIFSSYIAPCNGLAML